MVLVESQRSEASREGAEELLATETIFPEEPNWFDLNVGSAKVH